MNVVANGRFLTQRVTGVQRYARNVMHALDALLREPGLDRAWNLEIQRPGGEPASIELDRIPVRTTGVLRGHLWEQLELPARTRSAVLLSLCNTGPLATSRQVVNIHDASVFAFPESYSPAFRRWYGFLLPRLAMRAAVVTTDSHFSREQLAKHLRIAPERMRVVYPGADHMTDIPADPNVLRGLGLEARPYFLAVGSQNPSKNMRLVLEAAALLDDVPHAFVFAGGTNPRVFRGSTGTVPPNVVHAGYVSDPELKALYSSASAFIFPSLYEGFGLPPLEAMACNCPALVADIPVLREVCGDAARFFDPRVPSALVATLRDVLEEAEGSSGQDIRRRGSSRAKRFTWRACASELLETIRTVG